MTAALEARDPTTTYDHVEPPARAVVAPPIQRVLAVPGHAGTMRVSHVLAGRSRRS
jgi:hypothetical protein